MTIQTGRNIEKLRHARNRTREQLAEGAGISVSYLTRIEEGKILHVHVKTLARIAYVLGVTIDELEKE